MSSLLFILQSVHGYVSIDFRRGGSFPREERKMFWLPLYQDVCILWMVKGIFHSYVSRFAKRMDVPEWLICVFSMLLCVFYKRNLVKIGVIFFTRTAASYESPSMRRNRKWRVYLSIIEIGETPSPTSATFLRTIEKLRAEINHKNRTKSHEIWTNSSDEFQI